jgi:hypothetical protein
LSCLRVGALSSSSLCYALRASEFLRNAPKNALGVALGVYDILKHGIDARCESKSRNEHGRKTR